MSNHRILIEIGERVDRVTVETFVGAGPRGDLTWCCRCDCGNFVLRTSSQLKRKKEFGRPVACAACWKDSVSRGNTEHGFGNTRTNVDPLYNIWLGMRSRCNTKTSIPYPRYGGRGIKICKEWDSFLTFRAWAISNGYRRGLTIDRVNVDQNYDPGNCEWVTRSVNTWRQGNNYWRSMTCNA